MRLYSPVDLTGNVNMIEKLVLGGTGTGDLPILSPTCHQYNFSNFVSKHISKLHSSVAGTNLNYLVKRDTIALVAYPEL